MPSITAEICDSLGCGFSLGGRCAAMIGPDWQYPHCGTSTSCQAACTVFPSVVSASPSIVVTCLPLAMDTGVTQERTARPSRCTVHAPHCAMPHPYLVPVSCRLSRSTHSKGVLGSASTLVFFPLINKVIMSTQI